MSERPKCEMFTTVVKIKEVSLLSKEDTRVIYVLLDYFRYEQVHTVWFVKI